MVLVEASEGGGDCDGESPSEQEQEQVREDSPDKEIEATEKPPKDETRQKLKNLIGASIDEKLQLLQVTYIYVHTSSEISRCSCG